jgi:hypothetical protein
MNVVVTIIVMLKEPDAYASGPIEFQITLALALSGRFRLLLSLNRRLLVMLSLANFG